MGGAVLLQVFQGIAEWHPVCCQECMDLQPRTIAKQAAYLFLIEFARLVPCQGEAFKHMAGHIMLYRLQMCCHSIREMDSNVHGRTFTSCIVADALFFP